jgi:hypothetical protein
MSEGGECRMGSWWRCFGLLLVLGIEVVKGKDEVVTILQSRRKKRAYCRAAQGLDT